MFLVRNTVYDNQNNIPFYNPSHEPEERSSNPPDYGTSDQTYIIDGSGTQSAGILKRPQKFGSSSTFHLTLLSSVKS